MAARASRRAVHQELGKMGGEGSEQPMQTAMGQIGPLLMGMQAGTLIGQLSLEAIARYDHPIPREARRRPAVRGYSERRIDLQRLRLRPPRTSIGGSPSTRSLVTSAFLRRRGSTVTTAACCSRSSTPPRSTSATSSGG